jgi:hypothetical protein
MKRRIKLTEADLYRIVKKVIRETEEKEKSGTYFTLGKEYFYVRGKEMFLADNTSGEFSENLTVELPNTKEISAIWGFETREINDPETKGDDLQNLDFDKKMRNAIKLGKEIYTRRYDTQNVGGGYIPIVYYSLSEDAPVLAGMIISTSFEKSPSEEEKGPVGLRVIENPVKGDKITYKESVFKPSKRKENSGEKTTSSGGKTYGISLQHIMSGNEIDLEKLGLKNRDRIKTPKKVNIGEFFDENSSEPKNFERASFLEDIRKHIKSGGKISKITIEASTSKMPAGHKNNNKNDKRWKELNEYDSYVMGNNDDGTGNLQLCKHKAMNTYKALTSAIPELASAPYVLKAAGPVGEYVHIKFE